MSLPTELAWALNNRETERLVARLQRLELSRVDRSVSETATNLRELLRNASTLTVKVNGGVRVRKEFVCLRQAATTGSDRSVPPPHDRPPSTRLMGRKGIALRLMMTALFEVRGADQD